MIEQDTAVVEIFSRIDGWQSRYYTLGEQFALQSVGLVMSVAEVYEDTQNPDLLACLAEK